MTTLHRWILRVAVAQLLVHIGVAAVLGQPDTLDGARIDYLAERVRGLELQTVQLQSVQIDVGILKSEMTEVKWLSRGVTMAVLLQFMASMLGRRMRVPEAE